MLHTIGFTVVFLVAHASSPVSLDPAQLFQLYRAKQEEILIRYLELENKADGLTPAFRKLLSDRKSRHEPKFQQRGKALPDPILLQAIITERKRLESEIPVLEEWAQHPFLIRENHKKTAANLLRLETSEIVLTFLEYMDEFNRGVRPLPSIKRNPKETAQEKSDNDLALLKLAAGTLLVMDYPKERKAKMAFSNPAILSLNPEESKATLELIESGLGKMTEDALFPVRETASQAVRMGEEAERLNRTRKAVELIDKLAAAFTITNKPFFDDYQYHVIKLKKTLEKTK